MKKLLYIISILFLIEPATAQDPESSFGKPNPEELILAEYEKDPEAEAVVLFDVGVSEFFDTEESYDIRFTRTKRTKIFSRSGVEQAEVKIPFYIDGYGKTEKITSIEAYTYNIDNGQVRIKKLDPSTIFEEQINNRWRVKKFVFPDVKEGSVIEYKYVLETPFHFNLPDWKFQDKIPTVYSKYQASLIPFYEYAFIAQGISNFDDFSSVKSDKKRTYGTVVSSYGQNLGSGFEFSDMIYTYVLKDIPAFKNEGYITSEDDYIMKIDFQLSKFHSPRGSSRDIITTWPELIKGFYKHELFGKYYNGSQRLARKILGSDLIVEGKSNSEKAKAIIDYVRKSYSWNYYNSRYASTSPKKFLEQKTGNTADVNLFLTALLNEAGVEALPVLISTRSNGKIKADYPFEHFFNSVIVFVKISENESYLTDGTETKIAYNRIPIRCINERGLLMDEENLVWLGLEFNSASISNKEIQLNLDLNDMKLNSMVTIQATEFEAYAYKNALGNDTINIKDYFVEKGFSKIDKIKILNYDNNALPFIISYKAESPVEQLDSKIIFSPFLGLTLKENSLRQKSRTYPVDFVYSRNEQFRTSFTIPAGYDVLDLPEDFNLSNDLAEINVQHKRNGEIIESVATYSFKKSVYQPNEYARIKYYLDTIVQKFNEQIILNKI